MSFNPYVRLERLKQIFPSDTSFQPEEEARAKDREADGEPDGVPDGEKDRDDLEDDDEDKDSDYHPVSSSDEERETFNSKNWEIIWSSTAYDRAVSCCSSTVDTAVSGLSPGPTMQAKYGAGDIASTFSLFITPMVEDIILENTNREGRRKYGDEWREMYEVDLLAYIGLLILAGVYRSRGEAAASLWHPENSRALFRATMPLKQFHTYSRLLRFDDRETRPRRRASDKLAAIREVWDLWVSQLPCLYNPGPEVTVDEQLVPFRGRCPFRQYMPSKPAKYGIKSWVACDSKSSYAWNMQVYTGKPDQEHPERGLGLRVVLDVTEGLHDCNVRCDNYFTSYKLAQQLLERNLTLVATVRRNKPWLPRGLLTVRGREALSSKFAFTPSATLVSYFPKKNKNVLLMSTLHTKADVSDRPDRKPVIILDYNRSKGGVDNLDKVVGTYSCRRMTARWPLVIFHNMIDVSSYNAFVIWRELYPDWMQRKLNKRRFFLEELGKALVSSFMEQRERIPRTEASIAVVKAVKAAASPRPAGPIASMEHPPAAAAPPEAAASAAGEEAPLRDNKRKRKRCYNCPRRNDTKTGNICCRCDNYICKGCSHIYCSSCMS
ncbi:piggyBac transposable element-derived protein 4-like [Pleuronectes platessa]|uniref:piggyBac transposable element-derived protein 4-like n=1 Tax=Pleuronectes platessa TaxID=8262 RepID=UPI00232A29D7|nr:piggyBac transposable element-derived protein 4-like [Pleuronectes platessa]